MKFRDLLKLVLVVERHQVDVSSLRHLNMAFELRRVCKNDSAWVNTKGEYFFNFLCRSAVKGASTCCQSSQNFIVVIALDLKSLLRNFSEEYFNELHLQRKMA